MSDPNQADQPPVAADAIIESDVTLIGRLLPPAVHTAESYGDVVTAPLWPAEQTHIARAVFHRQREFATVRACARQALAQLGRPPSAILPGQRGAPQWPPGISGSMTHTKGYRAAAVAETSLVPSLGIDAEAALPLREGILGHVASADEIAHLAELTDQDRVDRPGLPPRPWDRLLFSAKEAVYKTWFPLTERWLGFEDARLRFQPTGHFTIELLVDTDQTDVDWGQLDGRWLVDRGLIITTVVLR
ncbi:MAG: 4'-phosphopantetheinyl transferase superfamily protein [Propionibacteriaceae bacterium]|jgi:4'-phosphopantetheinyl transferase EntD|nr:4'-phosphopantetheinyl transferase superfamily protein [Propionibacteriaceae bacterium]